MLDRKQLVYLKQAWIFIKKYRALSILIVVFSLISTLFDGFSLGTLVPIFSQSFSSGGQSSFWCIKSIGCLTDLVGGYSQSTIFIILAAVLLVAIWLKNIFLYFTNISINKIANLIKRDLQNNLFYNLTLANLDFFIKAKSGQMISSIYTFTDNAANFIYLFINIFVLACRLFFYVILLFIISWKITIVGLLVGLVISPLAMLFLLKVRRASIAITNSISYLFVYISEIFYHIPLIKIFSTEDRENGKFRDKTDQLIQNDIKMAKIKCMFSPLAEVAVMSVVFLGLIGFSIFSHLNIQYWTPFLIVYVIVFFKLFAQLQQFIAAASELFQRIEPFRVCNQLLSDSGASVAPIGNKTVGNSVNEIEFKNVCFGYDPGSLILKDVSFRCSKGDKIAIVGTTGSGKTTIANLLAGLYFPLSGQILINGIDLVELNQSAWHRQIGFVMQDNFILYETFRNNLTYGLDNVSVDDLEMAAKLAKIHDYIVSLPNGYDTVLSERGLNLSGGQKQRLSIARAILRKPSLLILDEATSSLDNETERLVLTDLLNTMYNGITIMIAHRLSTVRSADKIVVLEDGQVAEQGSHDELVNKQGIYYWLYRLQSGT